MDVVVCGTGPMGSAVAAALKAGGHPTRHLGRPVGAGHESAQFRGAEVVVDFSVGPAVATNVAAALEAGCRRFVIGTTAWERDQPAVDRSLRSCGAAAVVAPTFSPGVTLLLGVVERLAAALSALGGYDPYVVEWHRSAKRDRPSGTALALADRLLSGDPGKRRIGSPGSGPAEADALEVIGVRAGAAPGTHVIGWDASGETIELRVTARNRDAYAAGAVAAAEWLVAQPREPGLHTFESVLHPSIERSIS